MDGLQLQGVRPWQAKLLDIQWAEPLLDESALSYSLATLAEKYLGQTKQTSILDRLYGPKWIQATREVHPAHIEAYVLGDVDLPSQILDKQLQALESENLLKLFYLECRLAPMLLYMRQRGVRVDLQKAQKLSEQLKQEIADLSKQMEQTIGFPVNFNPSGSLVKAFEKLNIKFPDNRKRQSQYYQRFPKNSKASIC